MWKFGASRPRMGRFVCSHLLSRVLQVARVTEEGFFSFAAEKAGTKEWNLDAAKVMKPRVELNLREE